ncbi:hypothetical protein PMAYCL1PPCAC_23808 [Pristionchus mayeri]|uniref:Secreted protein n=1 Tax=Pristionchus mayeri TaxID=1317129 RepID=A0AAN5CZ34_9BILA|nr:hypothetical protein PMAYCL1PPCAC_23808 [Pristionchus mayeri]
MRDSPVMYLALLLCRNSTAAATSAVDPNRERGIIARREEPSSSLSHTPPDPSPRTVDITTVLTLTGHSRAITLAMERRAVEEAEKRPRSMKGV